MEYYITKPINRLEVIGVIQKVIEHVKLQNSIRDIQKTLSFLDFGGLNDKKDTDKTQKTIVSSGQHLLTELGMIGESGSRDLLDMLEFLFQYEKTRSLDNEFPALKDIFTNVALRKLGTSSRSDEVQKEEKASEQRVRRAIFQALNHLASLGLTDYSSPKFEEYASKFFDFTEVRKRMLELENEVESSSSRIRINIKKFVKVLYLESKKML